MIIYFTIGFLYSLLIISYNIYQSLQGNRNTEHWVGTLLVGTIFYPVHITSKLI